MYDVRTQPPFLERPFDSTLVFRKWNSKQLNNGVLTGKFILPEFPKVRISLKGLITISQLILIVVLAILYETNIL